MISATKTERGDKVNAQEALHQVLFDWGKRLLSAADTSYKSVAKEVMSEMQYSGPVRIGPVTFANVSLSNWQQQTMTQLTHALMLNLTKNGRDTDASYVMHLQQILRAGEIGYEQCLERLQRLCPDEVAELPTDIRAKLACIKQGIH